MSKYYKRKNNNDGDFLGAGILLLLFWIVSFISKYWIYFVIIGIIIIIYFVVYVIINKKTNFKPIKYYKGYNSENWLKELESNPIQNAAKIRMLKSGMYGENSLVYTLENSDIPMYILHDVLLKYEDKKAQIDVIAITKKNIYLLESKNFKQNINVYEDGTITRNYKRYKKGYKNPTTQNDEHERIVKLILKKEKILSKPHSLVVFTNNNSYVNYKKAISAKEKNVRLDLLIKQINKIDKKKHFFRNEKEIKKISDSLLKYTK